MSKHDIRSTSQISWERVQLSAENIERIGCLNHWQKSGISKEKLAE
jgi:hypothetical protein